MREIFNATIKPILNKLLVNSYYISRLVSDRQGYLDDRESLLKDELYLRIEHMLVNRINQFWTAEEKLHGFSTERDISVLDINFETIEKILCPTEVKQPTQRVNSAIDGMYTVNSLMQQFTTDGSSPSTPTITGYKDIPRTITYYPDELSARVAAKFLSTFFTGSSNITIKATVQNNCTTEGLHCVVDNINYLNFCYLRSFISFLAKHILVENMDSTYVKKAVEKRKFTFEHKSEQEVTEQHSKVQEQVLKRLEDESEFTNHVGDNTFTSLSARFGYRLPSLNSKGKIDSDDLKALVFIEEQDKPDIFKGIISTIYSKKDGKPVDDNLRNESLTLIFGPEAAAGLTQRDIAVATRKIAEAALNMDKTGGSQSVQKIGTQLSNSVFRLFQPTKGLALILSKLVGVVIGVLIYPIFLLEPITQPVASFIYKLFFKKPLRSRVEDVTGVKFAESNTKFDDSNKTERIVTYAQRSLTSQQVHSFEVDVYRQQSNILVQTPVGIASVKDAAVFRNLQSHDAEAIAEDFEHFSISYFIDQRQHIRYNDEDITLIRSKEEKGMAEAELIEELRIYNDNGFIEIRRRLFQAVMLYVCTAIALDSKKCEENRLSFERARLELTQTLNQEVQGLSSKIPQLEARVEYYIRKDLSSNCLQEIAMYSESNRFNQLQERLLVTETAA